ncbi:hypothetical protein R1sor_027104 [Riccia sorocarpa]|uniref:Uncharacterized protein n=1 Tax=Riccia sorocarpa TaxID=122646 RepID=A0ABD3GGY6_9MARC
MAEREENMDSVTVLDSEDVTAVDVVTTSELFTSHPSTTSLPHTLRVPMSSDSTAEVTQQDRGGRWSVTRAPVRRGNWESIDAESEDSSEDESQDHGSRWLDWEVKYLLLAKKEEYESMDESSSHDVINNAPLKWRSWQETHESQPPLVWQALQNEVEEGY